MRLAGITSSTSDIKLPKDLLYVAELCDIWLYWLWRDAMINLNFCSLERDTSNKHWASVGHSQMKDKAAILTTVRCGAVPWSTCHCVRFGDISDFWYLRLLARACMHLDGIWTSKRWLALKSDHQFHSLSCRYLHSHDGRFGEVAVPALQHQQTVKEYCQAVF